MVSERRAFGDRVRRQRERRGVTLQAIAHSTKIPAALFAGLERGDCSRWPAGVYSRAYVKAYAEAIGLDPNEAVEDFTAAFAETVWPDGGGATTPRRAKTAAAPLRLSMDDQPELRQTRALRRGGLAGADFIAAFALGWLSTFVYDSSWTAVIVALAYHALGRVLTDEPVTAWLIGRFRPVPPVIDAELTEEVAVSDVARTTA